MADFGSSSPISPLTGATPSRQVQNGLRRRRRDPQQPQHDGEQESEQGAEGRNYGKSYAALAQSSSEDSSEDSSQDSGQGSGFETTKKTGRNLSDVRGKKPVKKHKGRIIDCRC